MTCVEAREAILEADLPVLRGEGPEPLAQHLRSCPRCRARAEAVLEGEARLALELAGGFTELDLDRVIRRAQEEDPKGMIRPGNRWQKLGFRGPLAALVPLAAAATLAALFLGGPPSLPGPEYTPQPAPSGLDVEVPQGRNVAVLETENPEISVLWLF